VLAALTARHATGLGARLDVNLLSSLQGALANQAQAYLGAGSSPSRLGNAHPSIAPYETLECFDGLLAVACGNDGQFAKLAGVLGAEHLASDERFATNRARVHNRPALVQALEQRLATDAAAAWQVRLTQAGVPAGQVGTIGDGITLADSLGLCPTIDVQNAAGDTVGRQIRHPVSWTPPLVPRTEAPPELGEHSAAVRAWLLAEQRGEAASNPRQAATPSKQRG